MPAPAAARLRAQHLSGPPLAGPVEVCGHLLAVQAQELRGARLATRARTAGRTAADVDRALAARELVVSWVNRGTLHLVRSEDWPWLHALTTPQLATANRRRAHLALRATLAGLIVRGPLRGGEQAFALVRDWLGEPEAVDRDTALTELARRYLRGHGPATPRDLATWAGTTLGDARRGLARVDLDELPGGLVDLRGRDPVAAPGPPRLLGPFDPVLHGWHRRDWILEDPSVVTSNGIFRRSVLLDERIVGTWTAGGELRPLRPLEPAAAQALAGDLADVVRFEATA